MNLSEENKIARIFAKHYGLKDGLEIEQCIKSIILHDDYTYLKKLTNVMVKNGWSELNAQSFAEIITELGQQS
ncbi:MAG: hypothetical protein WBA23_16505 [Tunicatimonas sp.]|uniref:hypothetical protein n=1 Tax=Tunicatimonas sp. TaxID=1940096 RepID=UPI003C736B14